jgi:histidine triad (HIT) family protein
MRLAPRSSLKIGRGRPGRLCVMAKPCAFCAIVRGESSAHWVYDDSTVAAFLDTKPLFLGHTLLVPRLHVATLADLPADLVPHFFGVGQQLDRAVVAATGADGSMTLINNVVSQSVPHLHLHVIPRRRGDGLRFWLGPRQRYDDDEHAERTATAIATALGVAQREEVG